MTEEWRTVPDYHEYEVSDLGRVRRGDVLIKQRKMASGYLYVTFLSPHRKDFRVHRLVAICFLGEAPEGKPLVCHRNGKRDDNRKDNLRYDDQTGNQADCKLHGTERKGSKHGRAKISERDIPDIRNMFSEGKRDKEISDLYGVHESNIRHIRAGRTWRHV